MWRRGTWVFVLALVLSLWVMLWRIKDWRQSAAVGDGKSRDSYGFDLSHCLVPVTGILPAGISRDGLPSLDLPPLLDAAGLAALNASGRSAFLMDHDLVIGVALQGRARAYPLAILNWHEVVNDTLAAEPILVTWSPLSGAAAVYSRHTRRGVASFGVSGLLYNSNLLFYDRGQAEESIGGESLWCQLQGRAVAGPAAGDSLALLPALLTHWGDWRGRHPASLVLAPDPGKLARYRRKPYNSYRGNDRLQFPVEPLPDRAQRPLKTPILAVWAGGVRAFYPLPEIATKVDGEGRWQTRQGDAALNFHYFADPPALTAWLVDGAAESPATSLQAYWFAWYSQYPELFP